MNDKLFPNNVYHILNRGVNGQELFRKREDYASFIERYIKYINPIAFTYTYCLMPNHFHLLIKIKPFDLIPKKISLDKNDATLSRKLSQQFSNFFNSYAMRFNKLYDRKDKVFHQSFKKIRVNNENYFKYLIYYIHRNPVHHKFCYDLNDWKYSSYWEFLNNSDIWFNTKAFETFFESKADFKEIHHRVIENYLDEKFLLE